VIPTSLRDLCATRIAFYCTNSVSSIAVLGQSGAEGLPFKPGRALLLRGEQPVNIQAYMAGIETQDFDRFVGRMRRSGSPSPSPVGVVIEQDGSIVTTGQPVVETRAEPYNRATAVSQPVGTTAPPKIARGRRPTPEQATIMRRLYYERGWSKNRICYAAGIIKMA